MASLNACPVVRVKSWHPSQGDFVEINESDFNPEKYERYTAVPPPPVVPPPSVTPPSVVPHPALANLPRDWRNQKTAWLREFVEKMSGRTPETREQAIQMIEAIL